MAAFTQRSPPLRQQDTSEVIIPMDASTPTHQNVAVKQAQLSKFFPPSPALKRQRAEGDDADADPFDKLMAVMNKNQAELRDMNALQTAKIDEQTVKIDDLRNDMASKFSTIDGKVASLESAVGKTTNDIEALQRKLDEIEQDKYASHMEISGVENATVDANKNDLKRFVHQLISSFNITFDIASIEQSFVLTTRDNRRRIVCVFSSVAIKSDVMKKKREGRDTRKIFFDHRMTPATRNLFLQARRAAKEKDGRVFLYGGRVFYGKDKDNKTRIFSIDDINKIDPATQQ